MLGDGLDHIGLAHRFEVLDHRQVPGPPLATREGVVPNLAHQLLHEAELAAPRGARLVVHGEELAADEVPKAGGEGCAVAVGHCGKGIGRETAPEDRGTEQQRALVRRQGVDPGGEKRLE